MADMTSPTAETTPEAEPSTATSDESPDASDSHETEAGGSLKDFAHMIEDTEALDDWAAPVQRLSDAIGEGAHVAWLRGDWLGHAVHPMLTDLPIGCWTAASLLDLFGGRKARPAAKRLVALGVLTAVPTAAAGLVEWRAIDDERVRRVAIVHAGSNGLALLGYMASWRARRRGHHLRGAFLALCSGGVATAGGHLGGHLAFARGVGSGER